MIRMLTVLLGLALAAAPADACDVLSGATVHAPAGPRRGATVILDEGRVVAVGQRLPGLELILDDRSQASGARFEGRDCAFHQLGGKVVAPGFIEVSSQLGVVEVGMEQSTNDHGANGDSIRAALRVADGYNPLSTLLPIQRLGGVTGAVVSPTGGLVAGQAAFVVLSGERQSDSVVSPSVAMFARLEGESRPEGLARLRELLADADAWRRNRAAWERNQHRSLVAGASALDLEAMTLVLTQRIPLVVHADRSADIEALLRLRQETGIRLIVTGAAEGWRVADALAAARVPVVVDPLVYGAGGFDQVRGRPDNAALLSKAGVPVVLSTFSSHNARNLRQSAGNAVREGMEPAAALRAISATAAEAFGIGDRGTVAPGAVADLVVWSGDPLELSSHVEQVWIGGVQQPLTSRQTELREAYRALPGSPRPPLPLPQ